MSNAEQLTHVQKWLADHDAFDAVGTISLGGKQPTVRLDTFRNFQRLFSGEATARKENGCTIWTIIVADIQFSVREWHDNELLACDRQRQIPHL